MVFREVHNLTNYEVENLTQGQRYKLLIDTHTHTHKHNIIPIAVETKAESVSADEDPHRRTRHVFFSQTNMVKANDGDNLSASRTPTKDVKRHLPDEREVPFPQQTGSSTLQTL